MIDGVVETGTVYEVMEAGRHNRVPIIVGTNADETSRMVPRVGTEAEYEAAVRAQYGAARATAALAQYPASRFATPQQALVRLTTDATWTCPARRLLRGLAAHQSEPAYRYHFTWRVPGGAGALVGATHGLELPFVFRSFTALSSTYVPGEDELALSDLVQGYWAKLVSGGVLEGWPRYVAATDPYLELDTPASVKAGLSTEDCDVIDALAP